MHGLDKTKCYELKKDGSYLGKFVKTVDYYPDGPGRGGYTEHFFLRDKKEHSIYGPYWDLTPYEVVNCRGPMREQLAVESLARQNKLLPEQAQLVNQFLGTKDPKRVFTDATTGTGTGVSLPRPAGRRSKKSKRRARKTRRRHK